MALDKSMGMHSIYFFSLRSLHRLLSVKYTFFGILIKQMDFLWIKVKIDLFSGHRLVLRMKAYRMGFLLLVKIKEYFRSQHFSCRNRYVHSNGGFFDAKFCGVRILMDMIEGRGGSRQIMLEPELRPGGSVRAV